MAPPLQAYIQPPQLADAAGAPQAYIWAGRITAARQTSPRPVGQEVLPHDEVVEPEVFARSDEGLPLRVGDHLGHQLSPI